MKTTSKGRRPQNIKRGRSQQLLTGLYSNCKLKPPIYDDLKILKGECLSNRLLDHTQILQLSLYVQTACYKFINEDDL